VILPSAEDWRFEKERDAFKTLDERGVEHIWAAEDIMISDGSQMKVYPIGGGAWCWAAPAAKR